MLTVPVSERDHIKGPATAVVTIVEYGDFECPYCAEAYLVVKEIQRQLSDQLRLIFRHFPLADVHPYARHAAEVAGAQGKFWEMHNRLFEHQNQLNDDGLQLQAVVLDLNIESFQQDMKRHTYAHRVQEDVESGRHSRVSGTPTFFINGVLHDETYKLEVLLPAIKKIIESA
ncbi:MAG: hypothetical protein NVS2B12_05170 [Ktedonobacteraceae bacterium]